MIQKKKYKISFRIVLCLLAFISIYFILVFDLSYVVSSSMENTIFPGDLLLIEKNGGGLRLLRSVGNLFDKQSETDPVRSFSLGADINTGDILLFNFPEGDTIISTNPKQNYYELKRKLQPESVDKITKIYVPINKRPRYIKRCIGLPGDTVQIINGLVAINHKYVPEQLSVKKKYKIQPNVIKYSNIKYLKCYNNLYRELQRSNIFSPVYHTPESGGIYVYLTNEELKRIENNTWIGKIEKQQDNITNVLQYSSDSLWTPDDLGAIVVPKKGNTIKLNINNYSFYKRIISAYENNRCEVKDSIIFINGRKCVSYKFRMDYYFVMGDNRDDSYDSRSFGFLPENHIIGKAICSLCTIDRNKKEKVQIFQI